MDQSYYTGYLQVDKKAAVGFQALSAHAPSSYKTVPVFDPSFTALLDEKGVVYASVAREGNAVLSFFLNWILPLVFMFIIWRLLFRRLGNPGGNVLAFGQNKAMIVAEGDVKTRFGDVAGVDEAKDELVEVVDFLKSPKKYTEIGGKIPKGVLLVGPPGTGKTLLARAVAGEAEVPFFRMSGADFVEMFVGVGAARVRDLFKQAREKAPCIVFIDELDAIGKSRVTGAMGGNDEREQTLNQLLVEMDGFDATSGLIILAATNRPDVLDPALLRPGRFDRQVLVDRPDLLGREAILRIHAKAVKLDESVDLSKVARGSAGFVGADLANLVNEAALLAVRGGRKKVRAGDFDAAIEKIVAGLEKKSRVMNQKERRTVAFHETGHAITAALTQGSDPVRKVSIVPRGMGALGYTLQLPIEDRFILTRDELIGQIDVLLGGRAAEEIAFGLISTGARERPDQGDRYRSADDNGLRDVGAVPPRRAHPPRRGDARAPIRAVHGAGIQRGYPEIRGRRDRPYPGRSLRPSARHPARPAEPSRRDSREAPREGDTGRIGVRPDDGGRRELNRGNLAGSALTLCH